MNGNSDMRRILTLALVLMGVLGAFALPSLLNSFVRVGEFTDRSFSDVADDIVALCATRNYPPSCYDEEIPKLMDRGLSMEEAFEVTRLVQERDPNYFYCHVLGHNLSAKEAAKDLSKWTEVIARAPSGVCSNGAIHGAFQERFRDEVFTGEEVEALIPALNAICENSDAKTFTGLEQASCYHALGHLSMYITGASIYDATGICDRVAKKGQHDYTQTCYEGAYMQIFQPLEPEDFALIKDIEPQNKAEAEAFCRTFTGEHKSACHRESWPHYREELTNSSALQAFCSLVPDPQSVKRCYNAMFYVLTAQFNFDEKKVTNLCEGLPEARRGQCFANAASRFVETDYRLTERAVALCGVAKEHGVGERCFKELLFYSTFNFHVGSDSFNAMCAALPEPWSAQCFNEEGNEVHPSIND